MALWSKPLPSGTVFELINEVLDETLAAQEGDFDADTRWATVWFDENGFADGEFGRADDLARAKNTAVDALVRAGIVKSGRGKVRLLKPDELDKKWDPGTDTRLTAWEIVHQLVARLATGESEGHCRSAGAPHRRRLWPARLPPARKGAPNRSARPQELGLGMKWPRDIARLPEARRLHYVVRAVSSRILLHLSWRQPTDPPNTAHKRRSALDEGKLSASTFQQEKPPASLASRACSTAAQRRPLTASRTAAAMPASSVSRTS